MDGTEHDTSTHEATGDANSTDSVAVDSTDQQQVATKRRSIWRFKFLYGPHDPILWIALFLAASNELRTLLRGDGSFGMNSAGIALGPLVVATELLIPLAMLAVIRYPIAVITRSIRLSNARPRGADVTVRTEWLTDPARLGQSRLWTNGTWSNQTSGPPPRPSSTALTAITAVAVIITVILGLAANVSGGRGSGSSAIDPAAKVAVSAAQDKVVASTSAYTAYVKEFGSTSASMATVTAKLDAFSSSTDAVTAAAAAFPDAVPADLRSDYTRVGETGSALARINRTTLKQLGECADQACLTRTDSLSKPLRQQALDKWTTALRAIGVPI